MELNSFYDSLTDEQKEKVKACKTADEFKAFVEKEGIELTDEMVEEVAGGGSFLDIVQRVKTVAQAYAADRSPS